MIKKFSHWGINFLDIIHCPHKPSENCNCRKPKPGLIFKASKEFNIDLKKSFFIGDSLTDLGAANNAGCEGILLEKNYRRL